MHPAVTTPAQLDERYGRGPRRRLPMIVGGAIAVAAIAVFGWWTVQGSADAVDVTDRGFDLTDAHTVTVSFQISAPADRPVHCILEAQDEEFGIVGFKVIEYARFGAARAGLHGTDPGRRGGHDGFGELLLGVLGSSC